MNLLLRDGRDEVARLAVEALPEVRRYLLREKAKRPAMSDFGVRLGGKDQAWIYREEMREVWLQCPEAMGLINRYRAMMSPRAVRKPVR